MAESGYNPHEWVRGEDIESEFRVIPENYHYFISPEGVIKRRQRKGRRMVFKKDVEGFVTCNLIDKYGRPTKYRVIDLIHSAFPENED